MVRNNTCFVGLSFSITHNARQVNKGKGKAAAAAAAAAAPAAVPATSTTEVDKACPKAGNKGVSVVTDYDAKMNQTNISANNNKFYILQVHRPDLEDTVYMLVAAVGCVGCRGGVRC